MSGIRRILFPINFVRGDEVLQPTVRRMIEAWEAEVTLLHVIPRNQWLARKFDLERLMAQMRAIAGRGLDTTQIRCRLESGEPGERIVEHVVAHQIGLVVMSAGGSDSSYGRPIGPVADRVLNEAACPVWLDWGTARSRSSAGMYALQVACALLQNEADEYILRQAAEMTDQLQAGLLVVQAIPQSAGEPVILYRDPPIRGRSVQSARARTERLRRRYCPAADIRVERGPHRTVLSRVLKTHETGLLVTGNVREAILAAESECPVLRLSAPAAAAVPIDEPVYEMAARRSA